MCCLWLVLGGEPLLALGLTDGQGKCAKWKGIPLVFLVDLNLSHVELEFVEPHAWLGLGSSIDRGLDSYGIRESTLCIGDIRSTMTRQVCEIFQRLPIFRHARFSRSR